MVLYPLSYKAIFYYLVALTGFEPATSRTKIEVSLIYDTVLFFYVESKWRKKLTEPLHVEICTQEA